MIKNDDSHEQLVIFGDDRRLTVTHNANRSVTLEWLRANGSTLTFDDDPLQRGL
ncbi:hypothetical protein IC582_010952 [Cucumis melo]